MLGIVYVSFNSWRVLEGSIAETLRQCARSGLAHRVIVSDNASHDGTPDLVAATFPSVDVIRGRENRGPATAYNAGLRRILTSDFEYILVLNDDVTLRDGALSAMLGYMGQHSATDVVTPQFVNEDGSPQYQKKAIVEIVPRRPKRPMRCSFVGTTCALIRSDAFRKVGLYDEAFYFYNEDLDWAHRAKKAGCRMVYLPHVKATHFGAVGRSRNWTAIQADLHQANVYYLWKNWGPAWARVAAVVQRRTLRRTIKQGGPEADVAREALERMETTLARLVGRAEPSEA